jgi:uncharacterized protein YecE (DUF72 family)
MLKNLGKEKEGPSMIHSPMTNAWVGTSGWMYDDWRGPFYPDNLSKKRWLSWYAERFTSTEVTGSFYRTPSLEAVRRWRDETPEEFVFGWKASKFITHWKRLNENCRSSLKLMETRLKALEPKVGPVLFQLPPRFKANRERLASFLKMLSKRRRYAFEFRDQSWFEDEILEVLANRDVALCFSDHIDAPTPWKVTASHVYIRGHGPSGQYKDRYSGTTLRRWADAIVAWQRRGLDVYCYFDNDQKSAAPKDAQQLTKSLTKAGNK